MDSAIHRGDLALVQYLLQRVPDYRPGMGAVVKAAKAGCEALLKLLVRHPGYVGDDKAAGRGQGESLTCPYLEAARNGDLGTLTALQRLGVP